MSDLLLHPTSTAQWHALVTEAQKAAHQHLEETLESYLVFLLMRYVTEPALASRILAIEYLNGVHTEGRERRSKLRDVGDQCLLYSGLFPQRADRLRVKISYFVNLGRSAYAEVSSTARENPGDLYEQLAESFVGLMDILQTLRDLGSQQACLTPLNAIELWRDTGSDHARRTLEKTSKGTPIFIEPGPSGKHG